MKKLVLAGLSTGLLAATASTLAAEPAAPTRLEMITAHAFDVRMFVNGQDVSATLPIVRVKYNADGTGTRTLRDGTLVRGTWRFLDDAQRQIEVSGPDGVTRWVIVELRPTLYRKVNVATGAEFVHVPVP